jgi:hypothetical protein
LDKVWLGAVAAPRIGNHGSERTKTTKEQQEGSGQELEGKAPRKAGQSRKQKELLEARC